MKTYKYYREKFKIFKDRLFFMSFVIILLFIVITYQFYKLQVLNHDTYAAQVKSNVQKEVEIEAARGLIYDRYGRPLVLNKVMNVLQFDPSVKYAKNVDINAVILEVAELLEAQGDSYIDVIPISKNPPFVYTDDETEVHRFITNYVPYNDQKHKEKLYKLSAKQLIEYLAGDEVYDLVDTFSDSEKRKILAIRLKISETKYQKYKKVTIAEDVSMKVVASIEEHQEAYPAITAETETRRYYTYGKALGNIMGYMRKITESQYETLKEKGYTADDVIGQVGVEGEFESVLCGIDGKQQIEVDNVGRTVKVSPLESKETIPGNDVYLTIDAELQSKVYNALEKRLAEGIVARLKGQNKALPLTGREVIVSMAKNNQLDLDEMCKATTYSTQRQLYDKINASYQEQLVKIEYMERHLEEEERTQLSLKQHFANLLEEEPSIISDEELLLAFAEQGSLVLSKEVMQNIKNGYYDLREILINALEEGTLKPDQMDITPCSGTVVVVDCNNGQVLALVSYPSYDSNAFTQNFNEVYSKLHDGVDTRSIEFNRALKTVKAPGSTFKMITGIAGLEEGVIGPNEMIYDSGQFTKAGDPPLKCWIYTNTGRGHGNEDMVGALEVSCNYYFNEVIYRLGNQFGAPYGGIKVLSEYAEQFGLGEKTGIELEESEPNISNPTNAIRMQTSRVFHQLLAMDEEDKAVFYEELLTYIEGSKGFYPLGNEESETLEGQIDALSTPFMKNAIDVELGILLREDDNLKNIINRMIEDYTETLTGQISVYSEEVTNKIMKEDMSISLKNHFKKELKTLLKEKAQNKAKKAIRKMIATLPEGTWEQIFLNGYSEALQQYKDQPGKEALCIELKARIKAIENQTFDYKTIMVDKILERMLGVYLDAYLENVTIDWTIRDNISSAIGQGQHAFAPVQVARYIAGLANGKNVYNLTILSGIYDYKLEKKYIPHKATIYNTLNFNAQTMSTIKEGMRAVVAGAHGTARNYLGDFPIEIAAKTGTAEGESYKGVKVETSWITTFAPYKEPEIAVVSSMYGTNGLGSCTYNLVSDVYHLYFQLDQEADKISLSHQLVE